MHDAFWGGYRSLFVEIVMQGWNSSVVRSYLRATLIKVANLKEVTLQTISAISNNRNKSAKWTRSNSPWLWSLEKKLKKQVEKNRIGTDRWGCSLWAENVHSDVHGNTNNKMYPLAYFFSLISLVKLQVYLKCTQMYFFVSLTLVLTQTCSFLRVGNKVKAVTYSVCSSLLK